MPVLFVLCDSAALPARAKRLSDAVKEYGEALSVSETSYIVKTDRNADELFADLCEKTGGDDALWVFTVPEPYRGYAPASVKQWLADVDRTQSAR